MKVYLFCLMTSFFACGGSALADSPSLYGNETVFVKPSPTPAPLSNDYTDNVEKETPPTPQEMVLMQKPEFLNKPDLNKVIFNNELTNEFLFRYQQTFGYTEQEENYFLTSKQGYYQSPTGLTATQQDTARQDFAAYMVKRLAEYHTENILKNDPDFRPIYEAKQKLSNIKVDVGPQSKLDMIYSFVGNFANIVYANPWGTLRATINMDPTSLVPGSPQEVYLLYSRPVGITYRIETSYTVYAEGYRLLLEKRLAANMAANISETLPLNPSASYAGGNGVPALTPGILTLLGFSCAF